jgi:hypothetical protein
VAIALEVFAFSILLTIVANPKEEHIVFASIKELTAFICDLLPDNID